MADVDMPLSREEAGRLAELLSSDDGLALFRYLERAGFIKAPLTPPETTEAEPSADGAVGPWRPTSGSVGADLLRTVPAIPDGWAPVRSLRGSFAGKRVLLFGESTAAGSDYQPEFTPTKVIQTLLDEVAGRDVFEMLDLTKRAIDLGELIDVIRQSVVLRPDCVVIFAGNNFAWSTPESPDTQRLILRAGLAAALDAKRVAYRGIVESFLATVRAVIPQECRVVIVIPEVNLADFEVWTPVPYLGTPRQNQWDSAVREIRDALARGEGPQAGRAAERAVELDGETCPQTLHWLGQAKSLAGSEEDAYRAYRLAAEVAACNAYFPPVARVPQVMQDALLAESEKLGFEVVDLRAVFAAHTGSRAPSRRMFFDYCHMTGEGLRVAAASIAHAVLQLHGCPVGTREQVLAMAPQPSTSVEGAVRFMAAIRNLRVNQRSGIVEYWLRSAFEHSPDVAEQLLLCYLKLLLVSHPAMGVVSSAYRRIIGQGLKFPWFLIALSLDIYRAGIRVLAEHGKKIPAAISEELAAVYGPSADGTELTHAAYNRPGAMRAFTWVPTEERNGCMDRVRMRESGYSVVLTGDTGFRLEGLVRAGPTACPGSVSVAVNGHDIGELTVGRTWSPFKLEVPASAVVAGVNEIRLGWNNEIDDERHREALQRNLELGLDAAPFPVFGEIASLKAFA